MIGWMVRMVPGVSQTMTRAATEMAMFTFLSLSGASDGIGAHGPKRDGVRSPLRALSVTPDESPRSLAAREAWTIRS